MKSKVTKRAMLNSAFILIIIITIQVILFPMLLVNENVTSRDNDETLIMLNESNGIGSFTLPGSSQTVKYVANRSETIPNTNASDNVSLSAISSNSDLVSANATFQFNLSDSDANYTIENDLSADLSFKRSSIHEPDTGSILVGTQQAPSTFGDLNSGGVPWIINSTGNAINVTFGFNISNFLFPRSIRHDFNLRFKSSENVSLDVHVYDQNYGKGWIKQNKGNQNYSSNVEYNVTLSYYDNHSQSINATNSLMNLTIEFNASSSFQLQLFDTKVRYYQAQEVPITNSSWVALSFDMKGNATVKGFWMWIRSLNVSSSETLNFQIFKTNNDSIMIGRTGLEPVAGIRSTGPDSLYQQPDLGSPIASSAFSIANYDNDGVAYFNIPGGPIDLEIGNYFLLINSTGARRYSICVIPWQDSVDEGDPLDADDPDQINDHNFLVSTNNGSTWAKHYTESGDKGEVDAAPFIITLRRHYIPSDLNMSLSGYPLTDKEMDVDRPFSSSNYEWGLGTWNHENLSIPATGSNYLLNFSWNSSLATDFLYNASFSMISHDNESFSPTCTLNPEGNQTWIISYDFNKTKISGWTGFSFIYLFPLDWTAMNLTFPDGENYLNVSRIVKSSDNESLEYTVLKSEINSLIPSQQQGLYVLSLESPNYVYAMDTYMVYNEDKYYLARDFMDGDNMTARLDVQDGNKNIVDDGAVNITIFKPDASVLFSKKSSVINNTLGDTTTYFFNGSILYQFSSADAPGNYTVVGFWFNGSEAGAMRLQIFKLNYTVSEFKIQESPEDGTDIVYGQYNTGVDGPINTTISHVTINPAKENLSVFVNKTSNKFIFGSFNQSETIFNPGETINFSLNLSNADLIFKHSINFSIEIFQYLQPDRVIINISNPNQIILDQFLIGNWSKVINMTVKFPTSMLGYNTIIRNSLYQTRIKFWVDGNYAYTWQNDSTYAVKVDDNSTDGSLMTVKSVSNRTGKVFSQVFNRTSDTLFNTQTKFMMLLESQDGVTMKNHLIITWTNNISSNFSNLTIQPYLNTRYVVNNYLSISGILTLENGSTYSHSTNIGAYIEINGSWVPFNMTSGNDNLLNVVDGNFSGTFKIPSAYLPSYNIKLNWSGDSGRSILSSSENFSINLTYYDSRITITCKEDSIILFGDVKNFYKFEIKNAGNTTLAFNSTPFVTGVGGILTSWLNDDVFNVEPNESFIIEFNLLVQEPGYGQSKAQEFNITINAFSVETREVIQHVETFNSTVKSVNIIQRIAAVWYIPFAGVVILLFFLAFVALKKTRKAIKKPIKIGALEKEKKYLEKTEKKEYMVAKASDLASKKKKKTYSDVDKIIEEMKDTKDSKDTNGSKKSKEKENNMEKQEKEKSRKKTDSKE
ncbi:MAG: DNA-directed RNA polymerase I subunit RPA34 [Promethearchaeota archaeon]